MNSQAPEAERLIARFRSDPAVSFTDGEIACLQASDDLWAAKAQVLHWYRKSNLDRALPLVAHVAEREPNPENLKNVAVLLRNMRRYREAVEWMESQPSGFDPLDYHDLLCSLYRFMRNIEKAVAHGDEALRLKDGLAAAAAAPQKPCQWPVNIAAREENIISYSLWGSDPRYLQGALTNAVVARYLYPGWTPRFYIDGSIDAGLRDQLVRHGAQLVVVEDMPAGKFGTLWRFLVEDDPTVRHYIVRDVDSVVNVKERWAVSDWLADGEAFHVLRDSPQHSELMLAGMWGAHRGNLGEMKRKILDYVSGQPRRANWVHRDQHFLRQVIWPVVRNSVTIHDSFFTFMNPRRFHPDFQLPPWMHIGQNDWIHYQKGREARTEAGSTAAVIDAAAEAADGVN